MEEYIVSARKYRPLTFDSVVGQRSLTTTLKNAIGTGKLAHAYLFCGPRGVGKTTCARIFAKAINCLNPQGDGDACGECESCRAFNEGRSMNIHELDAASNNSVDDIRELCQQVLIPPQIGRYKVFIIDEVHMLSSSAFNAFLKTLEEPPSYVIFILATTEKHKILPTILSRCQVYDFQRMSTQNTIDHLRYVAEKEGYMAEPEALGLIAEKADGGMRDALSIFDQMVSFTGGQLTYERVGQCLNVLSTEYYFRLVDHFLRGEAQPCLLLFNEVLQKGFEAGNFIAGLATHLRNLLVSRDAQTVCLLEMSDQMRARYQEQAARCKPMFLYRAVKLCNDCDQAYRTSRNKRLQVEICLIQAAQLSDDATPGSGLGPEKILKPIFSGAQAAPQSVATAQPAPQQAAQPAPQATTQPAPAPSAVAQPVQAQPAQQMQRPAVAPVAAHPQSAAPARPALRKVSFKHLQTAKTQDAPTEQTAQVQQVVTPLTDASVQAAWTKLADGLSHEQADLVRRLRSIHPILHEDSTLELVVPNPHVEQTLRAQQDALLATLRDDLKNCEVKFAYTVQAMEEVHNYTNADVYRQMRRDNPAMEQLHTLLQLEMQ